MILFIAYKKFRFSQIIESPFIKTKTAPTATTIEAGFDALPIIATRKFHFKNYMKQTLFTSCYEFKLLTKNIYFLIILVMAVGFIFVVGFRNVGLIRGTQTYPVTSQVLEATKTTLYLFELIIVIFCSGELVWREHGAGRVAGAGAGPAHARIPLATGGRAVALVGRCSRGGEHCESRDGEHVDCQTH